MRKLHLQLDFEATGSADHLVGREFEEKNVSETGVVVLQFVELSTAGLHRASEHADEIVFGENRKIPFRKAGADEGSLAGLVLSNT